MIAFNTHPLWAIACLWFTFVFASSTTQQTKSFTTKNGLKYVYDYIPAEGKNATVLFIHGFPGSRHNWESQAAELSAAGYGIVKPDLIGFGDSDRPKEVEAYNRKQFSQDIADLLDDLGLDTVVGAGHDWGAAVLSGLAVWHPERFDKFIYLSLGYIPPGALSDIDGFNKKSLQEHGYMRFGYWYFFNSYDAGMLCQENLESAFDLFFPANNSAWDTSLADLGAARAWLTANKTTPLAAYLTPEFKKEWLSVYGQDGVIETGMNFYKAVMRGVQYDDEKAVTNAELIMHVPVLTISGTQDMIGLADEIPFTTGPFVDAEYTARTVDAGHWLMYEQSEAVSSIMLEFLASNDAPASMPLLG